LSIKLAKKFNGEIISADSRQVYKGLDIGTDKIPISPATHRRRRAAAKSSTPSNDGVSYQGVRHYLIDVASPKQTFTVAKWKKTAKQAVQEIVRKNKLPIIVGGTGFYIEALAYDLNFPEVKPNQALRKKLKKLPAEKLYQRLQKLDPKRAEDIDKNNPVRLIRAIEIAAALGKVPGLSHSSHQTLSQSKGPYNPLILGLKKPDKVLRQRINLRVEKRAHKIISEIKTLRKQNLSYKRLISFGLEYKYYSLYLLGKLTKKQAIEESKTATWRFARRQKTFFKRLPVIWVGNNRHAEAKIKDFLRQTRANPPLP